MALAPVSMGFAYDYSWLTLDNKLTNSFFFSLFQGGSVTTILHVFGKLSKNYYVVSLVLKSGFEKKKKQNNNPVATIDGGHNQLSRNKTIKT